MLSIEIHLLILAGLLLSAFAGGYLLRSGKLRSSRKKILELEKEMLRNHAAILELQKEKVALVKEKVSLVGQMNESRIPVIPIKAEKEGGKGKVQNNT